MCEEKPWEYPSLDWIHKAREEHLAWEKEHGPGLSPEAKAILERLNLPTAKAAEYRRRT
jgi:hypothetical protein